MLTAEIIKKHLPDKAHGENVKRLSLLLFNKLFGHFPILKNYENKLSLLEKGANLHDIGINFEKTYSMAHNKAGANFIYENKPEDISDDELLIICCLIRYHRKSLPKEKHKYYSELNEDEKELTKIFSAIIKLADAMDYLHMGLIENFVTVYDEKSRILTLIFTNNIMSNRSYILAMEKKKDLLEEVFSIRVRFKGT